MSSPRGGIDQVSPRTQAIPSIGIGHSARFGQSTVQADEARSVSKTRETNWLDVDLTLQGNWQRFYVVPF